MACDPILYLLLLVPPLVLPKVKYPADYSPLFEEKFSTLIVVDLETTGLDPWRNEILTWSMSALDYKTLKRKSSIELTFKPKNLGYWSMEAEEVHKISFPQALYFDEKQVSTERALAFIEDYCTGSPQILVCHAFDKYRTTNLFDSTMILTHLEKMGLRHRFYKSIRFFESTETYFREARLRGYYRRGTTDLFNYVEGEEVEEGKDFKLKTLCSHYKIKLDHHQAKSDREACEQLYRIARGLGETNEGTSIEFSL